MMQASKAGANRIDRTEAIEGIRRGLESFEKGKGKPAVKSLKELKRRIASRQ